MKVIFALLILAAHVMVAAGQWVKQNVNTNAGLRGLSVVSERVVWASGTGGTVIRTIDGGKSWKVVTVPGAEKLDFRDIEAFDSNTAYILSIGSGISSRIYKTTDGGATWKLQFQNKNEKAFFNAVACWDRNNCIAMSDPVDGHYPLISTTDGGNWKQIVSNKMPAAKDGEAAFAASGTSLITQGKNKAFLVSGGADARVFRSSDQGITWNAADTQIVKGTAGSGVFSIAMRDAAIGVIVGGNYELPGEQNSNVALTVDGGVTWMPADRLSGYRSAVTYVGNNTVVAVGTNGSDISIDGGKNWHRFSGGNFNSVRANLRFAWAVGAGGLVVKAPTAEIQKFSASPK